GNENGNTREITGILILLLALSSSTFSTIWVSRTRREIPPLVLSSSQFLFGGGLLLIASFLVEGKPVIDIGPNFWIALAWLVLVSSTAVSIWFHLLQKSDSGAGALSVWKFIIPVSGALLGWFLISGDSPDSGSVAGMLLIAGSVLFYFR
ncbi:MAG: EamA family transporter, partial [Spirochaetaceae bacterium]|nr:EamA family transporter [Spirochaetaceae bacterium]